MDLTHVLLSSVVTEKSTAAQANRQYVFLIHPDANKIEVKQAVETAYGVKVQSVNTIPVLKKVRLVGRSRSITKRPNGKKAIITLAPKQSLDANKIKV